MSIRYPRAIAVINDSFRVGIEELDVDHNSFFEADRFHLQTPIAPLPSAHDAYWFSTQEEVKVALYIGLPTDPQNYTEGDLTRVLVGKADYIDINMKDTRLTLAGRDLTGLLIDAATDQTWLNLSASEVATRISKKYGLTPNVTPLSPKKPVGSFAGNDWARLSRESAWDMLTYLADQTVTDGEHWVCYVSGETLYFGPRPKPAPFIVQWPHVEGLNLRRNTLVSKNVTVQVKGWNPATGTLVVGEVTSKGHKSAGQTYVYVDPGLSPKQAKEKAQAKLSQLMSHELSASGRIPGAPQLDSQSMIRIQGTNTGFDTDYYPYQVAHRFDRQGYTTHFRAKTHAPETIIK